MRSIALNYWKNLLLLWRGNRCLHPLAAVYYVTTQCNFNCVYCEDFGLPRNPQAQPPLALEDALRVLRVVRGGVDNLILSGGEPLLYPAIVPLVTRARRELRFRRLTLITNGSLLPQAEALWPLLDRLVVSLDSVAPERWSAIIRMPVETARTVLENVRRYAHRRAKDNCRLMVNCVLAPETLPGAPALLDFCVEHGLPVSFSPQAVCNWPRYELLVSPEYKAFLARLMEVKRRGGPVVGSLAYLHALQELRPFSCYPALVPRILPRGDLVYPCRPIEKAGGTHGGRPCNLLEVASWAQAQARALGKYGPPPRVCMSCFQQCYMEPALMQSRPLAWLNEWLWYAPSRRADLAAYAVG